MRVVRLALVELEKLGADDWHAKAGDLSWTCWETVEHMADDLFAYAVQLTPAQPSVATHVPYGWQYRREGGPALTVFVESAEGPAALLQVLESSGGLLAGMVATAPPDRLSYHTFGASDPSGFAAMGVVEVLVHTYDVTGWEPPADLCAAALTRLFPEAPADIDPWSALRWSTGRAELPGRPRLTSWRWDGRPR
ncbi:hypothetical protein Abr02nite_00050 [Paractinoplanes brasiliensis]|nr:hypothetical protein Abr02nite_00050 [Actinoplanes brasiliensis]